MIVGIVGGGQLARMLALAGLPLGLRFVFLDPAADACAAPLGEHLHGAYDDEAMLAELARRADVVTYEFESVPERSIEFMSRHVPVFPNAGALATARDRLGEKRLFGHLGIPTPRFVEVKSHAGLLEAVKLLGLPAVLKTRTLGYDGKGQAVLRKPEHIDTAWERLGGVPLILEEFVNFQREVSIIAVRGRTGETAYYPLTENHHHDGILRVSHSRRQDPFHARAREYARRLLEYLEYTGVFALELFQSGNTLLANEMAPRVHNSGHWTIEGSETSQFENHLRAILGLPLGCTDASGYSAMVNFIGTLPDTAEILAVPGASLHKYGKPARPGRKVGHATLRAHDEGRLRAALSLLYNLNS